MPLVGFEPTIPVSERPHICALDRAAAGTGNDIGYVIHNLPALEAQVTPVSVVQTTFSGLADGET
jgi:hypothetical protein